MSIEDNIEDNVDEQKMGPEEEVLSLESILEDLEGNDWVAEDQGTEDGEEATPSVEEFTANIEPSIESLIKVVGEIRELGAISRSDASTLSQMTASLEGYSNLFKTMPINSFTEAPSKVNFDVAMESLARKIWKSIADSLRKLISWCRERWQMIKKWYSERKNQSSKIDKAATAASKVKVDMVKAEECQAAYANVFNLLTCSADYMCHSKMLEKYLLFVPTTLDMIRQGVESVDMNEQTLDTFKRLVTGWDDMATYLGVPTHTAFKHPFVEDIAALEVSEINDFINGPEVHVASTIAAIKLQLNSPIEGGKRWDSFDKAVKVLVPTLAYCGSKGVAGTSAKAIDATNSVIEKALKDVDRAAAKKTDSEEELRQIRIRVRLIQFYTKQMEVMVEFHNEVERTIVAMAQVMSAISKASQ